jgi:short-subunit dehydrogenase
MTTPFANKTVWVTGASSGIGEALAHAFVQAGANVVLSARRREELERVQRETDPQRTYVLPLDLVQPDTFAAKTAEAIGAFGQVDILVHNGGVSQRSWVAETGLDVHRKLMEVDYFGYVGLTIAILPHFKARQTGHFVVMSSVMGKIGTPMRSAYAAAKHALHGFFDCLRAEVWQDQVQVTIICPGYIRTNVTVNALTATGEKFGQVGSDIGGGHPADKTAQQILAAVRAGKYEVFVGRRWGQEHLSLLVNRLAPAMLVNVVRKKIPK